MAFSKTYTKVANLFTLAKELAEIVGDLEYIKDNGDGTLTVHLTNSPTSQEEADVDAAVVAHSNGALSHPKIFNLTSSTAADHRIVNYKSGLTSNLFPKRVFVQGELQSVEYYADEALTDLVLKVSITYNRDSQGFAIDRTTTRTWVQDDESDNPQKKITKKVYDTAGKIAEGKRRRGNLIDILTNNVMGLMIETMAVNPADPVEVAGIIDEGRDFMKAYQTEISAFIHESHTGFRMEVQNDTIHSWLDYQPASIGGSTSIRAYIVSELTV